MPWNIVYGHTLAMEATMSREQRAKIDAMLRRPRPEGPRSVEALRAGFRAMMAEMIVPAGIRTRTAALGDRRAVLVEPADGPRAGRSSTSTAAPTWSAHLKRRCH
jgi:hypothetical protein